MAHRSSWPGSKRDESDASHGSYSQNSSALVHATYISIATTVGMNGGQQPPLDEIQWTAPAIAQSMGGVQTNTGTTLFSNSHLQRLPTDSIVLPYFSESPFFDAISNNATLTTQAFNNPNMYYIIQTRTDFEARLRTMQGLEFMVIYDPSDNGTKVENSGVWVIRKQNRRKRQGMQDEITPISSYYVVGENVYMAPSVGNIIGSRIVRGLDDLGISRSLTYIPAVCCHIAYETTRSGVQSAYFYACHRTHVPLLAAQKTCGGCKPSSNPNEQRKYTIARAQHPNACDSGYGWHH